MMQDDNLDRVALLSHDLPSPLSQITACDLLVHPEGDLRLYDIWRLRRSAECAVHAGQMNREVFATLWHLFEALRVAPENARLVGLDHAEAWRLAMATAHANPRWAPRALMDKSRAQVVGEACKRLTSRGHKLRIQSYGPDWQEASLRNACASIDYLVSRLGGQAVLNQCAATIDAMGRTFDEIWLFGDRGLGMGAAKEPAVPFGWLIGLAARHMHRPNTCRNPTIAWRSLVTKARDVAASFDCQRYGMYEGIGGISPWQIDEMMSEAMGWRSLFFTPQAPRLLLPRLKVAFIPELTDDTDEGTRSLVSTLFDEMIALTEHLRSGGCVEIDKVYARHAYPLLSRHACASGGSVNRGYKVPVRRPAREDTRFVMFDGPKNTFVVRPVAISIHAFCEALFGLVWKRLGNRAAKTVGNVIETAIADSCEGKAERLFKGVAYGPKQSRQEIDLAARSGNQLTLIEAKAKVLTRDGQIGASGQFYADYAQSFLPMVRQLARHDRDIKAGLTQIAKAEEAAALDVERIAISPVSFGPIGDSLTTTALMSALPNVRIHVLRDDPKAHEATEIFNDAVNEAIKEVALAAPKDLQGLLDFHHFFLSTRWLDLGQFLFALDRTDRVDHALRRVRHLTTGSRDFWTEFAFAQSLGSG